LNISGSLTTEQCSRLEMYSILQTDVLSLILLEAGGLKSCPEIQRMDTILQRLNSFRMTSHLILKSKVFFKLLIFKLTVMIINYLFYILIPIYSQLAIIFILQNFRNCTIRCSKQLENGSQKCRNP
jgi:hypothetical protein